MSNVNEEKIVETTQEEVLQAPLTEAENKLLDGEGDEPETEDEDEDVEDPPEPEPEHEIPEWAVIPNNVKLPPVGTQIVFMRIPAAWTRDPASGIDLQCVLWPLEDHEELQAYQRARGDHARSVIELAKSCIKIVNGEKADWAKGAATSNVTKFWKQCGPKARQMIRNYYAKQHMVSATEALDFFSKHFVSVTVQPAAK